MQVKPLQKLFKEIPIFIHESDCLFLCHYNYLMVLMRLLIVRIQNDEDLLGVSRYLNQEYLTANLMEVSIEYFPSLVNPIDIEA
jgi:hypothetical protein